MKNIKRSKHDQERCEEVDVEVMGGRLDGARVILDVVVETPSQIRVLEARYTRPVPALKASEVET